MSRKPIDQQQPTECRQAIWDEIRRYKNGFAVKDIGVRLTWDSVNEYILALVKAGYLEILSPRTRTQPANYRIIRDTGVEAPRVRKDGTPVTQGTGRLQMWNAMRILKTFRPVDLAFNASTDDHRVAESEAKTYCAALCKAGYLVGRPEGQFMLVQPMWTGPHPPQIQRTKQIYDPNLKRVVWSRIDGGAE